MSDLYRQMEHYRERAWKAEADNERLTRERDEARAELEHVERENDRLRILQAIMLAIRAKATRCPLCGGVWQVADSGPAQAMLVDPITGKAVTLGCTIGCAFDAALEGR